MSEMAWLCVSNQAIFSSHSEQQPRQINFRYTRDIVDLLTKLVEVVFLPLHSWTIEKHLPLFLSPRTCVCVQYIIPRWYFSSSAHIRILQHFPSGQIDTVLILWAPLGPYNQRECE